MERVMKFKDFKYPKVTVNPDMKDYSKDPYILNKVEEMKEFLKIAGIPNEILEEQTGRKAKK